ncbi:hypothetical protein [Acidiphilium acidophilum]|uniref:Uncharacterized protein n=1 Tax=Acidiphilium acidophilum TaxID=76588 RepID=A0AAW9DWJ2_ACIAO|nr:hypothetical protein [Acidiphilium acidophilum]MDX5932480.1 hypothetical protein [Acidiphilium acidophilum]GBQ27031.1 hypothetical protein AA700_1614 [Acidiphilium acidophilum DSM 700]
MQFVAIASAEICRAALDLGGQRRNPKPKRIIWPIPLDPADIRIPDANYHGVHFGPGNRSWPPRRKHLKITS